MTPTPVIALKLDEQRIKLVELRQEAGACVVTRAAHGPAIAPMLGAVKRGAMPCVAALPREAAVSRILTLPTVQDDELQPMIALQVKSLFPYGQGDLVFDFLTLRRTATHTTVLLLGVPRALVDQHLTALHVAGLPDAQLTLATTGLLQWYRVMRPRLALTGTVLLLELDAAAAECLIVTDEALGLTRSLSLGQSSAWLDELDRTLESYRKESGGDLPATIVLTGDPAQVAAMAAPLQEATRLPVRTVDQWQAVRLAPGVTPPAEGAWSSTVGLALLPGGRPLLSLLPVEARRQRLQQVRHRAWLTTAGLGVGVLCAATGFFAADMRRQQRLEADLRAALADLGPSAQALAHAAQRMTRLQDALQEQGALVRLLEALYQLTPADILLTQMVLERHDEARLRGTSPTLGGVLTYVEALEQSDQLQDVQVRYSAERTTQQGAQVEFEIVCRIP